MAPVRNFQSRLGSKMDKIKRKLFDNQISLTGNTLDFIRVTSRKSKQGDIESRIVEEVGVIECVMPPMIDIPMRRILSDDGVTTIDSFAATDSFPFEVYTLNKYNIDRDDILFRVIIDPDVDRSYCMVIQVKDTHMTLGSQSPLFKKFSAVYYDQKLPNEILNLVISAQAKREKLGW
jgi:hypothetical protein